MTNSFPNHRRGARAHAAFTLIELLTVIAVIAIIAALLMPVFGIVKRKSLIFTANSEMEVLKTAIQSYHDKFGYYPPSNANPALALTNQLYYELLGTIPTNINGVVNFTTLDGSSVGLTTNNIVNYFGTAGFMNCNRGSGDDQVKAQSFLPALKPTEIATNKDGIFVIVTKVNSPSYTPMAGLAPFTVRGGGNTANPWRYVYPGVNNPNSYDLWLKMLDGNKTILVCNWNNQQQNNSTLP